MLVSMNNFHLMVSLARSSLSSLAKFYLQKGFFKKNLSQFSLLIWRLSGKKQRSCLKNLRLKRLKKFGLKQLLPTLMKWELNSLIRKTSFWKMNFKGSKRADKAKHSWLRTLRLNSFKFKPWLINLKPMVRMNIHKITYSKQNTIRLRGQPLKWSLHTTAMLRNRLLGTCDTNQQIRFCVWSLWVYKIQLNLWSIKHLI